MVDDLDYMKADWKVELMAGMMVFGKVAMKVEMWAGMRVVWMVV